LEDTAYAAIRDRVERLFPEAWPEMYEEVGRAAANFTRDYLYALDPQRENKLGGPRTHFYAQAADATTFTSDADGAVVIVAKLGMRLRYYGGTITAGAGTALSGPNAGQPAQALAIPVSPLSYGKRPGDFDGLKLVGWLGAGGAHGMGLFLPAPGLAQHFKTHRGAKNFHQPADAHNAGELLFVLKKSVTQAADQTVLPPMDELADFIAYRLAQYLGVGGLRPLTRVEGGAP
jgi:hypothetical protein